MYLLKSLGMVLQCSYNTKWTKKCSIVSFGEFWIWDLGNSEQHKPKIATPSILIAVSSSYSYTITVSMHPLNQISLLFFIIRATYITSKINTQIKQKGQSVIQPPHGLSLYFSPPSFFLYSTEILPWIVFSDFIQNSLNFLSKLVLLGSFFPFFYNLLSASSSYHLLIQTTCQLLYYSLQGKYQVTSKREQLLFLQKWEGWGPGGRFVQYYIASRW